MSFDKTKLMRSAERCLTQGKIGDAVKEYVQVVENDPKDFNTMNILGDLYVKINEKDQAVIYFNRVAEHYSKQGFAQKAIAVYNKIAKINPNSIEVSAKLAPLYHLKGSLADAKNHYSIVAENYQNQGKKIEALNIWKRVAELDPNNTEIYLKLAEGYLGENQREEAALSYIEAATRLKQRRNYEKAAQCFSHALELKPSDHIALDGYVSSQIEMGQPDDAVIYLTRLKHEGNNSTELLALMADCHMASGSTREAEAIVIALVEKEPSNYAKFLDVVAAYMKGKDTDSATRVLNMASEHLLVGGKAEEYKALTEEVLNLNPEHLGALRLMVRLHGWMRNEEDLKKTLEEMAEIARLNGADDDEKFALAQLVNFPPFEPRFAERLEELGGPDSLGEAANERIVFGGPAAEGEVPQFENFENLSQTSDFQGNEGSFAFSDNSEEGAESSSEGEAEGAAADGGALSPSLEMHLHQELESVDFYISNEYGDLAIETLNSLERQFGKHPEIQSRKEKLGFGAEEEEEAQEESSEETSGATDFSENEFEDPLSDESIRSLEAESASAGGFEATAELEAAGEFETTGEFEASGEAEAANEFETAGEFETANSDEFEGYGAEPDGTIEKLDAGDSPEYGELENADPGQAEDSPEPASPDGQGDDQFSDFRSDLGFEDTEAAATGSDFETHFNMGIAYKEMGLLDEAAKEFQDAVKAVSADDGSRNHFQCCNWLGHCFMDKGMPQLAIKWFERCFETDGLSNDERKGLIYEIALAHETDGDKETAKKHYEQIYGEDIDYRDIGERLKNL